MSIIRCISGSETFSTGFTKLYISVVHSDDFPLQDRKPVYLSNAAKAGLNISEAGRLQVHAASTTGLREQGNWFDNSFNVRDGVVLKIFAHKQHRIGGRASNQLDVTKAAMFIQAREGAAARRIELSRLRDRLATTTPVIIEGRFDVLSLKQVGALGAPLSNTDLLMSGVEKVRAVLSHTELSPAKSSIQRTVVERVETGDGELTTVKTKRQSRAINLD